MDGRRPAFTRVHRTRPTGRLALTYPLTRADAQREAGSVFAPAYTSNPIVNSNGIEEIIIVLFTVIVFYCTHTHSLYSFQARKAAAPSRASFNIETLSQSLGRDSHCSTCPQQSSPISNTAST
jgi:hypothetical protein